MKYEEKQLDLFSLDETYSLVHCISADFGMGAGIVVEFNKRYNMKEFLLKNYLNYVKWMAFKRYKRRLFVWIRCI